MIVCKNSECRSFEKQILPKDSLFCPYCGHKAYNKPDVPPLEFYVWTTKFRMIFVEHGEFFMGAPDSRNGPVHKVILTHDFYMADAQVTQAQWKAVMGDNPPRFIGDDLPVESVCWDEIQEFLKKLNQITGKNFRLPTEAEWEFAAQGGNTNEKFRFSGSDNPDEVAWLLGGIEPKTYPVYSKKPNLLGIYGMTGNVWEWCNDWYAPYENGTQTDPQGPAEGRHRVARGGSFKSPSYSAHVHSREEANVYKEKTFGLRIVLPIEG